jgi:hypothetical protein
MDQYLVIGPDGKEFGPIDLAGLQQWIREGRVLKQTRVRKNGGAVFAAEGLPEVAESFAQPAQPVLTPPIVTTVPIPAEFRSWQFIGQGWELFKPHWLHLCLMMVILSLVGAIPYVGPFIAAGFVVAVNRAVLGLLAGRAPRVEMMFTGFDRYLQGLVAAIIIGLVLPIAFLCLIVPGIYLALLWSQTYFVLADTNQDFWSAMQSSIEVTKGYRWEIFCLWLAYFLIMILGLLVFCVGIYVSHAVGTVAFALAYRFLQFRQRHPQPQMITV